MAHQEGKKRKTLISFFKPSENLSKQQATSSSSKVESSIAIEPSIFAKQPPKSQRVEFDENTFERDPGERNPIWKYPVNQRDVIRRAYINKGPFQPQQDVYPPSTDGKQNRRFQYSWFKKFPWLEYSLTKDAAYCFPCFLFESESSNRPSFTTRGFRRWKRVNDGAKCAFLTHVGCPTSPHNNAVRAIDDLMKVKQHIDSFINVETVDEIENNRLRLTTTIKSIRWLVFQACALRGHDESIESKNRGNFIELIKFMGSLNVDIDKVVLENAPQNAEYTSPIIQKEILHIFADKVRNIIREEVGDSKFSILVDEAKYESSSKQMAIILRFVDVNGFLRERFFEIVHVSDTAAVTLKKEISNVLSHYNLQIQNMRGQGYDGASNMRGAWNRLQALFLKDCPYAYYIHCFVHKLQLALVAAAQDEFCVWQFFSNLTSIVNLVSTSSKRHDQLQSAQTIEIAHMLATGEHESGRGANQIGTLFRFGATCWSSHFDSICSLVDMYDATCTVLQSLIDEGQTRSIRGEAAGALMAMRSFDFIFILNLMHKIMGITDLLCKALQQKYVDVLSAMNFVSTTKALLHTMRQNGWDSLIMHVESTCRSLDIDIPEMGALFKGVRSRKKAVDVTVEHHYRIDIFDTVIDHQLMELNTQFNEGAMEILILSSALEPKDGFKSFKIDDICKLAEKFYPGDFTKSDIFLLRCQLQHYEGDILCHQKFQNMSTISELCRGLVVEKRSEHYYLIDRLIRLVLTLPVSTATTKRTYSAMKLAKSEFCSKMGDDILRDSMVLYIEKDLAETIDSNSIIDDFYSLKKRRVPLL